MNYATFYQQTCDRLNTVMGPQKAAVIITECLKESRLRSVESFDEMVEFAEHLLLKGGFAEVVARSIKTKLLLATTKERASELLDHFDKSKH